MKKATYYGTTLKVYCGIFGHRYRLSKEVTSHVKEYTCSCCEKQLTTDSNGKLTELTPVYKEINSLLEDIYTRRMMRLKNKTLVTPIFQ